MVMFDKLQLKNVHVIINKVDFSLTFHMTMNNFDIIWSQQYWAWMMYLQISINLTKTYVNILLLSSLYMCFALCHSLLLNISRHRIKIKWNTTHSKYHGPSVLWSNVNISYRDFYTMIFNFLLIRLSTFICLTKELILIVIFTDYLFE